MKTLLFVVLLGLSATLRSQEYPSKPIHFIVPLTPGSGADIAGRIVAQKMSEAVNLVKDGKLAPLGVSTRTRAEVLPEVTPLAEQGFPDYEVSLWFGMWAPAATPAAVVQKLNAQVNAIVQQPEVRAQFGKLGIQPAPMPPAEFAKFVRSEIQVYRRIVAQANIPPQ